MQGKPNRLALTQVRRTDSRERRAVLHQSPQESQARMRTETLEWIHKTADRGVFAVGAEGTPNEFAHGIAASRDSMGLQTAENSP